MVLKKAEKDKVRALLVEAITVLCKNGLGYKKELCVEGLLGITLDKEDVFLVNIQQTFGTSDSEVSEADSDEGQSTEPGKRKRRRRKNFSGKKRTMSDRSNDGESADESYSADVSNRLSESGGEPREKRQAVDGSEVLTEVKQEPVDEVSDDEDIVFVKSDPGEGGFEGGGGDRHYSNISMSSTMPNLSTNIPLNYEGPGCSSWDNSTSSLDASAQMVQGDPSQQGALSDVVGQFESGDGTVLICNVCGKEFVRKHHMRDHLRIHTGEKPFRCPFCDYRARQQGSLSKHIKTKHREQGSGHSQMDNYQH